MTNNIMENILSNLPKIVSKKKKRIGRGMGSGRGSKSGRGTTRHQKAREAIPLHFEGGQGRMVKKFPLLRGKGRNKPIGEKAFILNLKALNQFHNGDVVNIDSLLKKGLIVNKINKQRVKILANGKITKKLIVKVPVSKSAKGAIEKAGGKVEI